mmetsp:Transcript_9635/g.17601  ORF Transcript_9635/g.17601 Transcript_9635/m.17601 type:complete len:529 (-) Transcript_9635:265-1851(-)|eukprot:CAMPEP_0197529010 /NCGR_PEP_ID=MMETSP1318-20131121/26998_1 /TAXON_ID=552666 /ORGANISM="Partenskyella glossopodia, Strain RCC365" /LENGTH=528 /DNA_ID=CAMNT_0043084325 /DNA_START=101 /DNA_END=1687 /DNA_ORIENTATION=-
MASKHGAGHVQPVSVGVGQHALWGYSPSFDLARHIPEKAKRKQVINILLAGPGDVRHVLETLKSRRTWQESFKINVYIWEDTLECIVRDMLLFKLATDQTASIEARIQTFLEAYGNIEVHKKTNEAIALCAQQIYKGLGADPEHVAPFFDLSLLKSKEIDGIEDQLNYIRKKRSFDAGVLWTNRCRSYLDSRYDAAENIVDWDYHMQMKHYAPIIHKLHYKRWRLKGIIVERLGKCTEPNRTLATYVQATHRKRGPVNVKGYWSDIVISPYIAFGVHTTEFKFYERAQNQYKKHSVDICEFNLSTILEDIAPCTVEEKKEQKGNGNGADDGEILILDAAPAPDEKIAQESQEFQTEANVDAIESKLKGQEEKVSESPTADKWDDKINVRFLAGDLKKVLGKSRYQKLFDVIFISQGIAHVCMSKDLNAIANDGCRIIAESVKYLPVKRKEKKLYIQKLQELGKEAGWESLHKANHKERKTFSFPMPETDRGHTPKDPTKAVQDKKVEQDAYPECMFPFCIFDVKKSAN